MNKDKEIEIKKRIKEVRKIITDLKIQRITIGKQIKSFEKEADNLAASLTIDMFEGS